MLWIWFNVVEIGLTWLKVDLQHRWIKSISPNLSSCKGSEFRIKAILSNLSLSDLVILQGSELRPSSTLNKARPLLNLSWKDLNTDPQQQRIKSTILNLSSCKDLNAGPNNSLSSWGAPKQFRFTRFSCAPKEGSAPGCWIPASGFRKAVKQH